MILFERFIINADNLHMHLYRPTQMKESSTLATFKTSNLEMKWND